MNFNEQLHELANEFGLFCSPDAAAIFEKDLSILCQMSAEGIGMSSSSAQSKELIIHQTRHFTDITKPPKKV